jgi:hypothetical protein
VEILRERCLVNEAVVRLSNGRGMKAGDDVQLGNVQRSHHQECGGSSAVACTVDACVYGELFFFFSVNVVVGGDVLLYV